MISHEFKESIKPFFWITHKDRYALCLEVGTYKEDMLLMHKENDSQASGYDWQNIAKMFLTENLTEHSSAIDFDSEAGMFCCYSSDYKVLQDFAISFKQACETTDSITKLILKADI